MDCVTCKTTEDKLRWAVSLYSKNKCGTIDIDGLQVVLKLIDPVEDNGFINGPSDEDLEELLYRFIHSFIFVIHSNYYLFVFQEKVGSIKVG